MEQGLLSSCGARASHCGSFSCHRAQTLGSQASIVAAHGLSICGAQASGDDGIPVELLEILKDDAVCTQYSSKFGKLSSGHRTGKGPFSFQSQRKTMSMFNYHRIALISHASKVTLKILQTMLEQYMNQELPDVQTGLGKDRKNRDRIL